MRSLWNIISFLAVVHLLALIMFVIWLWQSQRLTSQRIEQMRDMFSVSAVEERDAAEQAAQEAEALRVKDAQEQRKNDPPLDSASQVQHISTIRLQEEQARRRLDDEKEKLLRQLAQSTAQINQQQVEFERQRLAWEQSTKDDQQRKTDEQFLQTVKQYEQLPPKQGKRMLMELVNQNQMEQAVAYLHAMNARAASKILKEFKTDSEIALATKLLERLRTLGKEGDAARVASATSSANAPQDSLDVGRSSPARAAR
jgi:hypothetical protein